MKKTIRLDKALTHMGLGTRKEVKSIIKQKRVAVDGKLVSRPGTHVDGENQSITLDGKDINYQEFFYFIINKPKGVISATEDYHHKTVIDLLEQEDRNKKLFPVGRLDIDTEGLLILTNDGQLAHNLLSPKKKVAKTYYAEVKGVVTSQDVDSFNQGVVLEDGYKCMPAQLKIIKSDKISHVEIIIREGKFHQIKRMIEAVGKKVIYLKRIGMGGLKLPGDLELGQYRLITKEEKRLLFIK